MNKKIWLLAILVIGMVDTIKASNGPQTYAYATGRGKRSTQEDRCVAVNNCIAIYDGSLGAWLAQYMKKETKKALSANKEKNGKQFIENLLDQGEQYSRNPDKVSMTATEKLTAEKCLTTAAIAYINSNSKLTIGHVGDTRIILVNKNGDVIFETSDHKPDRADEKKRLEDRQQAMKEAGDWDETEVPLFQAKDNGYPVARCRGVAISRGIGCNFWKNADKCQSIIMEPEWYEKDLNENDGYVIAGCDGIWDALSTKQVVQMVHEELLNKKSVVEICNTVVKKAIDAGSQDNVSMALLILSRTTSTNQNETSITSNIFNRYSCVTLIALIACGIAYWRLCKS